MTQSSLIVFHLDMNFVALREDYLRQWLYRLASMGYNAILWELENKVQWETCPECVDPEAMSKETFRDLLRFSRELGLEPIPLLQTIGHAEYVLLHEKYHSFRENPKRHDCYCTSNSQVREHLRRWITEYLDLFGEIRYFHLGGDEAYEFGKCDSCRRYIEKNGHNQLYSDHLRDIAAPMLECGVRPCVWADMVLGHPDEINQVQRDFVLWDWNYAVSDRVNQQVRVWGDAYYTPDQLPASTLAAFPQLFFQDGSLNPYYTVDFLLANGFEVVLCSAARSGGSPIHCGRHRSHSENVVGCARKAALANLTGTCVTSWGIRQYSYETQAQWLPLAPLTMRNPGLSYTQLLQEAGENLFGCDPALFFQAISLIGTVFLFDLTGDMGIQWNALKDQLPAPTGFMASKIAELKTTKRWQQPLRQLDCAEANLLRGNTMLHEFVQVAPRGFQVLTAWLEAAKLQLGQLKLARGLVDSAEGRKIDGAAYAELAAALREEYRQNAESGQKSGSAGCNATLLYHPAIEYFKKIQ